MSTAGLTVLKMLRKRLPNPTRRRLLFLCLLWGGLLEVCLAAPKALVLYDGPSAGYSEGLISSNSIANLLGHFSIPSTIQSIEAYRKGSLQDYDWTFFAGNVEKTQIPPDFLEDVVATSKPVFWLNRHINQLTAFPGSRQKFGFGFVDYRDDEDFNEVIYRGVSLRKTDPDLNLIRIENYSVCRVWAQAKNRAGLQPYIIQSGHLWYVADSPFSYVEEGDRYLAFCDLLHDFLGIPHQIEHKALVRIEDVSVDDDPEELRRVADYLSSQQAPFQIALIPIFRDPAKGFELLLSDRPQFLEALKYMVARGGSIVLHGVTHQFRGVSADDYEFWDDLRDQPVSFDAPEMVRKKLETGLVECFKNGLYPLAWETPHYAASPLDHQVFAEFFSLVNERRMVIQKLGTQQYFPFPVTDIFGQKIIPENLGFVSLEDPKPGRLSEDAGKMLAVRDGIPSFFFHSFMKLEYLKRIVQEIRKDGYDFVSLKSFGPQVKARNLAAQTVSGPVHLTLENEFLRLAVLDSHENVVRESVSTRPLSGQQERQVVLGPGQMAVLQGLTEKPQIRTSSWYERWQERLSRIWPASSEAQPLSKSVVPKATLLWTDVQDTDLSNDQESYYALLKAYGIETRLLKVTELSSQSAELSELVFVPYPSGKGLTPTDEDRLMEHVRQGGKLVLDGETGLSRKLGIKFEERLLPVTYVTDLSFPDVALEWRPTALFSKFAAPKGGQLLLQDQESLLPLATMQHLGKGAYIFLGPLLDPQTRLGVNRFPYLFQTLRALFGLQSRVRRPQAEFYFDPGLRAGISLERLVRSWREAGVKILYTAAWAGGYRQWYFNYDYFIELCHKNGILVYAWFELPQVDEKFWDAHPEWREVTATGADGRVGWRMLMNLYNPQCRRSAFAYVRDLVQRYPWDGVNIAELNFDTDHGPSNPSLYVPMNEDVRRAFKASASFDPMDLFNPRSPFFWQKNSKAMEQFNRFRTQIVTNWHREILEWLTPLCQQKGLELVVTMLDSLHSQNVTRDTGVDSNQILSLLAKFPFTLQVEDPAEFWAQSPDRFARFVETYLAKVPDRHRLILDLNVVPSRSMKGSLLPASFPTGAELAQMLHFASQASGRVAVYSESTVTLQDLEMVGSILAQGSRISGSEPRWELDLPRAAQVRLNPSSEYHVDGQPWPFRDGGWILVPHGRHILTEQKGSFTLFDLSSLRLRMRRFTGELLQGSLEQRGLRLRYSGSTRAIALLNKRPYQVLVDGKVLESTPGFYQGDWSVVLPRGTHEVEILANSPAHLVLDLTSLLSSSLIVVLGFVVGGLLVGLYVLVVLRRWTRRRPKPTAGGHPASEKSLQ